MQIFNQPNDLWFPDLITINFKDHNSIFQCTYFIYYIQEEDEVLIDSYANIKHIRTGRWLHLDKTGMCFIWLATIVNFKLILDCFVAPYIIILYNFVFSLFFVESCKRKDFKPEKGGLHAVQWDFAKLYEVRKKPAASTFFCASLITPY